MLFQLLMISSLGFSQSVEVFHIQKVNSYKQTAQVSKTLQQNLEVGQALAIETASGKCQVDVTEVYNEHFYINTRQCSPTDVAVGTEVLEKNAKTITDHQQLPNEDFVSDGEQVSFMQEWAQTDFYQNYVTNKLSTYISYHVSNTLEGEVAIGNNQTLDELTGSNTIGFGAEYRLVKLPHRLSLSGGVTYELPRSFGEFVVTTAQGNQVTQSFGKNPTLYLWNFYANVRYHFTTELMAYVGMNRLFAEMKHLPGDVSWDLGFHFGGRYYPYNRFFVDGSMNFYNLDYAVAGNKADLNLTEFEIKGGYTF